MSEHPDPFSMPPEQLEKHQWPEEELEKYTRTSEPARIEPPSQEWNTDIAKDDKLVADPDSGALKADGNKLRFDLMPPEPLEDIVRILTFGAAKYSSRNWEQGMKWSRPFGAAMRHLWAWWRGESLDPDSGCSHLAHAAVNIVFLMEYERTHKEYDDRPTSN